MHLLYMFPTFLLCSVVNIALSGVRETWDFFLNYPRVERCGCFFQFSQSRQNPVTEIEITIQGKFLDNKKEKLLGQFAKQTFLKVDVKAKGAKKSDTREYKLNIKYERGVLGIKNSLKVQFGASGHRGLDLPEYVICVAFDNQYPAVGGSYLETDLDNRLTVQGTATVKYGEGKKCQGVKGATEFKFEHSTTELGRQELREKDFYKECEEQRQSAEWSTAVDPWTEACWRTLWDSALARRYSWQMNFEQTTPLVQNILTKAKTVVKAALLPYYDVDDTALEGAINDTPKIKCEMEYKDGDSKVDATFITDKGTSR